MKFRDPVTGEQIVVDHPCIGYLNPKPSGILCAYCAGHWKISEQRMTDKFQQIASDLTEKWFDKVHPDTFVKSKDMVTLEDMIAKALAEVVKEK